MNKLLKVSLNGKIKWRNEYDFFTVYHFETDDLFKVPKTAIDILEVADGTKSIDEIINYVIRINNLNTSVYQKIYEYIDLLNQKELINFT
ncbi:MAG: hypothetical protein E7255_07630 [Lachnospiraceae bacterium]|nr:hypothetical protein [Lachnospiraceae bacterium]